MRLIDVDEFMETVLTMKRLNEECPLSDINLENEEINNYETGQRETFELIIERLGKQPTACDPEKIVQRLGEVAFERYGNDGMGGEMVVNMDDAIDIVKGEYATEQSCEWELEDAESNLYVTGCENRQLIFEGTPEENGYKYCH